MESCSWDVTSPHSFTATFNTPQYSIPTGPTTLYAAGPNHIYEVVADFIVTNTVPCISSIYPASANRGTTANTWVYTMGVDATSTLITDTTPFGLITNTVIVTPSSWSTESPGQCYQVTTTLPQTMAIGDWLFYMIFNQDNFSYNINKTFGVTDNTVTWTGSVSSDWNNANNWDPAGIPSSGSNVIIPYGIPNNPSMNVSGVCYDITINSGGQLTIFTNTLNVENNFTIANNGNLLHGGGTVAVYGNVTNNGTYTADGGTFAYGGTAITQTIASSIDYHNLSVTGGNKVLSGNTSVYSIIYLDGAGIDIGNYDLVSYTQQVSQTTPNEDYIITSGTGALQYSSLSSPAVISATFPVGPDANNYNPVSINNNGVALNWFKTYVQNGIVPSHPNAPWCLPLTWDIKCDPLGSWNATIGFEWSLSQENSLFTQARLNNNGVLNICEENVWQPLGPVSFSSVGNDRYSLGFDNLKLVSGCAVGDGDHTLPIELSSFTAQFISNLPVLCWTTQSESGNAGWNVYRGDYLEAFINGDAIQINPELIEGAGTTSIPTNYTFEDQYDVIQGSEYWYILESVDYSGETFIHGSVSLIIPEEGTTPELPQITVLKGNYPNPFNPFTSIIFDVKENETAQLSIFNAKGQKIESISFEAGTYNYLWDASSYASGTYLYKLESETISVTKKMILLK